MLVTEPSPRLIDIVRAAVDGGVDIVQWRHKDPHPAEIAAFMRSMREAVTPPALLLTNYGPARAYIMRNAFQSGDDGIHFPEGYADGRATLGWPQGDGTYQDLVLTHRNPDCGITGESVHSVDAARRAEDGGADYLVAGNIFETGSHPGKPAAGVDFLSSICRAVSIPVIAIGGITPQNAPDCLDVGAAGVAVLSAIMRAPNARIAAAAYRAALDQSTLRCM